MTLEVTRREHSAEDLRRLARRASDANQACRLLALAMVLDGASREASAKAGGMTRQTLRDWVIRDNALGVEGLVDRAKPGRPPRLTAERALEFDALVMPHANTGALNAHLQEIARHVAPGAHAVLVLDGAGWHTSHALEIPDNLTCLVLPPYAPELNPVENIWQHLRQNQLAIRLYESYQAIVEACCKAWNDFIAKPERITSIATRDWAKMS